MIRRLWLAAVLLLGLAVHANAQTSIDGSLLGMGEAQLLQLFPAAKRLPKPRLGPHGLRGTWQIEPTPAAALALDTTFFITRRQVLRIEQLGVSSEPACQEPSFYAPLLTDLQTRYGVGLTSRDTEPGGTSRQSELWVSNGVDVMLHVSRSPSQCTVRVIYEPHMGKDASEL